LDEEVEKKHAQDEAIGYTVHIPAFMLNKENGDVVKKFAEKSMGKWAGAHITLKADIEMPKAHEDYVSYSLWYTSFYDLPKDLLVDLYEYEKAFNDTVKFTPKIVTMAAPIAP